PDLLRYQAALGVTPPQEERGRPTLLPQYFADRFGWDEVEQAVDKAYETLTPDEKSKVAIFADNYGEAGAIDYYGRRHGLPKAICGHNSYWLWGPHDASGELVITFGPDLEDLQRDYEQVTDAAVFENPYAMPYESGQHVYICRRLRFSIAEAWPRVKHFI